MVSTAFRLKTIALSQHCTARNIPTGSSAFSTFVSSKRSSRTSASKRSLAAATSRSAFSILTKSFASAALSPLSAGTSAKSFLFFFATGAALVAAGAATFAATAVEPPPPSLAPSNHDSVLAPGKHCRSPHTRNNFFTFSVVVPSPCSTACLHASGMYPTSASAHSGPFFRLFCTISLARYKNGNFCFAAAARNRSSHVPASVRAFFL
mmetsp:Transcript_253/g.943  ORF Transcript_253/g.943 Transcript_253/m.943 type:complete len:208 (+) Transcript_253:354-977(+)